MTKHVTIDDEDTGTTRLRNKGAPSWHRNTCWKSLKDESAGAGR